MQEEFKNNANGYVPNCFTYPYGIISKDSINIIKDLGFKASSFFGCNFIPMALRPAQFTFKMRNGIITYETRRKIIASNFEECYFENSFNILPLNELILCLDKNKNDIISRSKILLIDKEDYEKVLKGKKMVRKKEY